MVKKISPLVKLAFPIGLAGTIMKSYALKVSGDTTFEAIGIGTGILIGSVTAACLVGFLIFVHLKLFAVPKDLFTGSVFGKTKALTGGDPAIFRQGLVMVLCLAGAGLGFALSSLAFKANTLGVGISLFIPGIAGSALLIGLWRRLPA